jgi:NADH:ubiquinone oxidoreductase subunit
MLTAKFWKQVKDYGLLNTYRRGHKTGRNAHYMAGYRSDTYVKCVGQDQFGNTYYEDFDVSRKKKKFLFYNK